MQCVIMSSGIYRDSLNDGSGLVGVANWLATLVKQPMIALRAAFALTVAVFHLAMRSFALMVSVSVAAT